MGSDSDFAQIQNIGSTAQSSMIFTLIIPFVFMVFMKASMDRVWSLYNMF